MKSKAFKLTKQRTNASSRRTSLLVSAVIMLAVIIATGFYMLNSDNRTSPLNRDAEQVSTSKTKVANNPESNYRDGKAPSNESVSTNDEVATSDTLKISITSHSQSNGIIKSSAQITGSKAGKCVFTYTTDGDRPVVRETNLSNGICGIEIPEVEFTKLGSWNLKVTFYALNSKAEVNQNVTIN